MWQNPLLPHYLYRGVPSSYMSCLGTRISKRIYAASYSTHLSQQFVFWVLWQVNWLFRMLRKASWQFWLPWLCAGPSSPLRLPHQSLVPLPVCVWPTQDHRPFEVSRSHICFYVHHSIPRALHSTRHLVEIWFIFNILNWDQLSWSWGWCWARKKLGSELRAHWAWQKVGSDESSGEDWPEEEGSTY